MRLMNRHNRDERCALCGEWMRCAAALVAAFPYGLAIARSLVADHEVCSRSIKCPYCREVLCALEPFIGTSRIPVRTIDLTKPKAQPWPLVLFGVPKPIKEE